MKNCPFSVFFSRVNIPSSSSLPLLAPSTLTILQPPSDSLLAVHGSCAEHPEPDMEVWMWPPECQLEGNQHFSPATGYALVQAAQPAVGFHRHKDAALPHITFWATRFFFLFFFLLSRNRSHLLIHSMRESRVCCQSR